MENKPLALALRIVDEIFKGDYEKTALAIRVNPATPKRWTGTKPRQPEVHTQDRLRQLIGVSEADYKKYLQGKLSLESLWELRADRNYDTLDEVGLVLEWCTKFDMKAQFDIATELLSHVSQEFANTPARLLKSSKPVKIEQVVLTSDMVSMLEVLVRSTGMFRGYGHEVKPILVNRGISEYFADCVSKKKSTTIDKHELSALINIVGKFSKWISSELIQIDGDYDNLDDLIYDLEHRNQVSQHSPSIDSRELSQCA